MIYLLLFFLELPPLLRLEECLLSTTFIMVNIRNTFQHTIYIQPCPHLAIQLELVLGLGHQLGQTLAADLGVARVKPGQVPHSGIVEALILNI